MLRAIRLVALVGSLALSVPAAAARQDAKAQFPIMNKVEFDSFLARIGRETEHWRAMLKVIDFSSVHVDYQDGRQYEQVITMCLSSLNNTEIARSHLAKTNSLVAEIMLLQNLSAFRAQASGLASMLHDRYYLPDATTTRKWADELVEIATEQASPIIQDLYVHLVALSTLVDTVIDVSDPYAPRIRSEEERAQALGMSKNESKKVAPKDR